MEPQECIEGLEIIMSKMKPKTNFNPSSLLTENALSKIIENKDANEIQEKINRLENDYESYNVGVKLNDGSKYVNYELCLFPNHMKWWLKEKSLEPFIHRLFTSNFQLEYQNQLVEETYDFFKGVDSVKEKLHKQIDLLKTAVNDILKEKSSCCSKESSTINLNREAYDSSTSDQYTDFGTFA